ncbi:TonB-dependent receptor [Maribellus sediminis]|uniref:TonB-dependent receptor n=1 Tax=Maribellus sediminis TaxID=2696285 RepID=UPI0014305A71|nr:TonB-dependent receptor plug domain-containing protein [Maribellus sediminis]
MLRYLVPVLLLLLAFQVAAQTPEKITVSVRKTALNQVLLDLKENYGFQFAYDSDLLSKYTVTVNRTFSTKEETLKYLVKNLPLDVERSNDVFLIIPQQEEEPVNHVTTISGQVLEAFTEEPLPYSYILINRKSVQADQQGHFNFIASADTSFNLQISHLGFFIYDTLLTRSINRKFYLTPQLERIDEVEVISNPIEKSTLIGDRAGRMKINHQIAPILPGHGDNSVFTLLRLMPGILAAGEQSNDLMIWGAYEGHSKIQFDGFTLFGLKNFNDNISVVNPLMVKNIEVMKGGYDARYGGRVGGIVDIAGKDGTMLKPTLSVTLNSTTVNSMLQLPLSKKSSLMAAYRQTYYQLYDPTELSLFRKRDNGNPGAGNGNTVSGVQTFNYAVKPDYFFRDANLKYTFRGDDGSRFAVSLYGGGDEFKYNAEREVSKFLIIRTEKEENRQYGGSIQLSQPWDNGDVTNFMVAYSAFEQITFELDSAGRSQGGIGGASRRINSDNSVDEIRLKAEHSLNFEKGHKLLLAVGVTDNRVQLSREIQDERSLNLDNKMPRLFAYVQDEIPLFDLLELKTGIRATYASRLDKIYFEPRVSASVDIAEGVKFNAAWGLYNQFTSKTTLLDSSGNFATFWMNADGEHIEVLNSEHIVAGVSYNKDGFTASAESFYKTTDGLNRYFSSNRKFDEGFYQGNAKSYGIDIFVKKEYKRHMAWISYTLSETKEHFPFYLNEYYQPAPQQQKHELKVAGIVNYKRFYFSANYVYGSGFERFDIETQEGVKLNQPYNRADASLVYKFKPGKVRAEAGISVLNVFNTDNIKYSNLRISTIDEISLVGIYADAVPFTPALFVKIEL